MISEISGEPRSHGVFVLNREKKSVQRPWLLCERVDNSLCPLAFLLVFEIYNLILSRIWNHENSSYGKFQSAVRNLKIASIEKKQKTTKKIYFFGKGTQHFFQSLPF